MWQFLSRTVIDTNVRKSQKRHEKTRYFYPVFGGFFVTIENIPTPQNSRMYVSLLSTVEGKARGSSSQPPLSLAAVAGRGPGGASRLGGCSNRGQPRQGRV